MAGGTTVAAGDGDAGSRASRDPAGPTFFGRSVDWQATHATTKATPRTTARIVMPQILARLFRGDTTPHLFPWGRGDMQLGLVQSTLCFGSELFDELMTAHRPAGTLVVPEGRLQGI